MQEGAGVGGWGGRAVGVGGCVSDNSCWSNTD